MGKSTRVEIPDQQLAAFDHLVERFADIERKGKTSPYTSVNGHMFSLLGKDGVLGIRLSKADQATFRAQYESGDFIQHGAVMRDYVKVPDDLLLDITAMVPWFEKSHQHAQSLKPK
ncbi:hypothetical protein MXMO3_00627 [Maritalea myrionectae]|uniref:TfoX N-terminal domain-containing protein n=1 Tax=Maritalea myrionectae TaxID=454601 RepID=A0A2R4MAW2_9HYPH|nr:hypothetical protein [Maritalea myrionectae]AVX03171.1 hypothetical protein MXMO3_00627 [Maritalea myrionectae]